MTAHAAGWAAAVALWSATLLGVPSSARAFERSRVEGSPDTALFWRVRTVVVHPASDTSDDLDARRVELVIERSLATWNASAVGCSDLVLVDGGEPSGLVTSLDGGDPDLENRVVFREDAWPEDMSANALALTTVSYRPSTGQILDADIDINGAYHRFTDVDDPALASADLENTLTHELGHLIGLAHDSAPESTMYPESAPGELDKRSLTVDDASAACVVYPAGRLTPDAPWLRGTPLTSGCSAASARASGAPASDRLATVVPMCLAMGLLFGRRRR